MLRQILSTALTLIIFFLVLSLYTKIAGPIPFSVNSISTQKSTTFDVTGEGKTSIKPDNATVSAGVTTSGSTTEAVQNQMNAAINKVSSAIKALGIDEKDIQTQNYSVNPNYSYTGGTQKADGYIASTTLTIKVKDINKVNSVIDAATAAGATNVNNLGFDTLDKTKALNEARKIAVADAKKKAQDAANIAGFKLGKIINYSESTNTDQRPIPMLQATDKASSGTPTQVEPGTNEVQLVVTLSYEIN
jgi:uncharacterized protein